MPEARPLVLCTPSLLHGTHREGAPPCTVHWRIPSGQGLWQVALSGWAQGPRLQLLSRPRDPLLLCPGSPSCCRVPPNWCPPGSRSRSYLTMQHLVARLPGALPPSRLFPYLGGKRNRETEGDRSGRPGVLPVQPSLGRRHQAATRVGAPGFSASARGSAAGKGRLPPLPVTALRLCTLSLAASQVQLPLSLRSPAPPGAEPAPATHPRAQTHAPPTNTRVHTHKHVLRAHSHTHGC